MEGRITCKACGKDHGEKRYAYHGGFLYECDCGESWNFSPECEHEYKNKWIFVKEDLPEVLESVLFCIRGTKAVKVGYCYLSGDWQSTFPEVTTFKAGSVLAWKRFPEPPKEDS